MRERSVQVLLCLAFGFLALVACSSTQAPDPDGAVLGETTTGTAELLQFSELGGWESTDFPAALSAFRISCRNGIPGSASIGTGGDPAIRIERADWQRACDGASRVPNRNADIRTFFERAFQPVAITARGETALLTGYFEPAYPAARRPSDLRTAPVLTRPADLVDIDLGAFRDDLSGTRLAGRLEGSRLVPYATAEEIAADAPRAATLGYVDPNDLLFLQIQGSGRLVFDDGTTSRVGYAAKNGHPYVAVGRTLVRDGVMTLDEVNMQSIRDWLAAASPKEAARVRHSNPSYVFFRPLDNLPDPDLGPIGAEGVQLTPNVSLAVDDEIYPYGLPVYVEASGGDRDMTGLYVAQDTGGAITGAQRADLFLGYGEIAGRRAGNLKGSGRIVLLVPRRQVGA